jgi:AraC-like DNA-binding protein
MYRGTSSRNGVSVTRCLALVASWDDRIRLRSALTGTADVAFLASGAEILQALRADRTGIRAVLLEAHERSGRPTAGLVRQITRLFPGLPVIGYCSLRVEDAQNIVALSSAGVHELAFKEHDHGGLLRSVLASAQRTCAGDLVLQHLDARLPPRVRPLVEYCLMSPRHAHTVDQAARALAIDRKTLLNHCRAAGFPSPGAVVAWCLILLTAALLASPGITVESVAMELDFPSATALRNMLKRHTGLRPADLRATTALGALCTRFLSAGATPAAGA